MKRLIVGVACAFIFTAGQASAEGLPPVSRIRAPDPGPVWSGFYVGGGIGAGAFVQDLSATYSCYGCSNRGSASSDFDGIGGEGIFGTVTVGYDKVIRPGWVAGVFADYDFSNMSSDISVSAGPAHFKGSLDHTSSWAVGGRLGYLVGPSTLVYGAAGYTQAEFDLNSSSGGGSLPTFHGYFVGAGFETFLRQNWTLKLEYRFSQFNAESLIDERCFEVDLEPSAHTARLVLSYKLGD
jgi:outer membrane immunogenic protein